MHCFSIAKSMNFLLKKQMHKSFQRCLFSMHAALFFFAKKHKLSAQKNMVSMNPDIHYFLCKKQKPFTQNNVFPSLLM